MTDFHGDEAKKFFLQKKRFKMADSKKLSFSISPILNILLYPHENQSKFLEQQGWVEILMITMVTSQRQHLRKHMQHSVDNREGASLIYKII